MPNDQLPNLDDARACLARAQKHYDELTKLTDPGALWKITKGRDEQTGEWLGRLNLNRALLVEAKPVLADCATNAISALDHVAAAIAKSNGHNRLWSLYFPLGLTDEAYGNACDRTNGALGQDALDLLTDARNRLHANLPFIEAAKQISYSVKHWALIPAMGGAAAVGIDLPGSQRIFNLPADAFATADYHEYYRGEEPLPPGNQTIVVSLRIEGLKDGFPTGINAILECSFRFVQGIIDAVAEAREGPAHAT